MKLRNYKNFIQNFVITGASNIFLLVFALLNNIVITRWLGPEDRGVYAVVSNIVILLNLVLGEGIRRSNTLIIGKNKNLLKRLIKINLFSLLFIALSLIIIFFARNLFSAFIPNISSGIFIIALAISFFSILWQAVQAIYLGLQKITFYNLLMIFSILTVLLFNLMGIYIFNFSLKGILLNMILSNLLIYLIGINGVRKIDCKDDEIEKIKINQFFSFSVRSTFTSIVIYILQRSGIFFMNFFIGKAGSGYFAIAMVFSDLVLRLPNVAGTLVFSKTAHEGEKTSPQSISRVIRTVILFSVIIAAVFFLFGEVIIQLLFGANYIQSYSALKYMIAGLIFVGPGSVIHSYFMGKEYPSKMILLNLFAAITAVLTYFYFIKFDGLVGGGIGYSIVIIVWTVSYTFMFWKETKIRLYDILIFKYSDAVIMINYIKKIIGK